MDVKVRAFLNKKIYSEMKEYEKEKNKTLIELGLYEKVYSPDNKETDEYDQYEWDSASNATRYYKIVPCEVTNEEYMEIKKYAEVEAIEDDNNAVGTVLTVIACVEYCACLIGGAILAEESLMMAIAFGIAGFISGTMFLGFAEIIKLLHKIKNK